MTQFKFTEDYDEYGQARSQISIAVPRGRDFSVPKINGFPSTQINKATSTSKPTDDETAKIDQPYLSTHTITKYAKRDDGYKYIVDRVACITLYEIKNDGTSDAFSLKEAITHLNATSSVLEQRAVLQGKKTPATTFTTDSNTIFNSIVIDRPIIGQTLNFYDGPAFEGLPFGQLGDYGVTIRTETLILTDEILQKAFSISEFPPYLSNSNSVLWTSDYPQEFRNQLPALAGYKYRERDLTWIHVIYLLENGVQKGIVVLDG